ncbi:ubiquinol oxidase subunit II [Pigmentiphaga soli]|uniref:Ubiquinol oxidase subunit 2 n=1 Tax=Pigmentiphaga soli TaxID=1007095 RepID=A0ABP8GK76_9BURK
MSKFPIAGAARALACAGATLLLGGCNMAILSPKGDIGAHEKTLLLTALGLMLIVVIPVIALTLYFAWKYRASNTRADYAPTWSHSTAIEVVVWTIPVIIVGILGVITWKSTHELDPYRPLQASNPAVKPLVIEVVSLDWKWLFIYPEQGIATVNEIAFPVDVPVQFRITSATVMNSFFIPRLGSQIYSMAGMETRLHLIAREAGEYPGISANYSGAGFSDMRFKAIATTPQGFDQWVARAKASQEQLTPSSYQALAQPSTRAPTEYFASATPGLFDSILRQHVEPAGLAMCTSPTDTPTE